MNSIQTSRPDIIDGVKSFLEDQMLPNLLEITLEIMIHDDDFDTDLLLILNKEIEADHKVDEMRSAIYYACNEIILDYGILIDKETANSHDVAIMTIVKNINKLESLSIETAGELEYLLLDNYDVMPMCNVLYKLDSTVSLIEYSLIITDFNPNLMLGIVNRVKAVLESDMDLLEIAFITAVKNLVSKVDNATSTVAYKTFFKYKDSAEVTFNVLYGLIEDDIKEDIAKEISICLLLTEDGRNNYTDILVNYVEVDMEDNELMANIYATANKTFKDLEGELNDFKNYTNEGLLDLLHI